MFEAFAGGNGWGKGVIVDVVVIGAASCHVGLSHWPTTEEGLCTITALSLLLTNLRSVDSAGSEGGTFGKLESVSGNRLQHASRMNDIRRNPDFIMVLRI